MHKFKTNIKCGGCVATVTPELDKLAGKNNWTVDVNDPEKILTVTNTNVTDDEILDAVKKAGFNALKKE